MSSKVKPAAIFIAALFIISLALPGPFRFRRSPRSSQSVRVEAEIAVLEQAFDSFRSEFGSRVPGSLQLPKDFAELAPRDRSTLRRLWPQLNFKAQHDFNKDGDTEDTFQLQRFTLTCGREERFSDGYACFPRARTVHIFS